MVVWCSMNKNRVRTGRRFQVSEPLAGARLWTLGQWVCMLLKLVSDGSIFRRGVRGLFMLIEHG